MSLAWITERTHPAVTTYRGCASDVGFVHGDTTVEVGAPLQSSRATKVHTQRADCSVTHTHTSDENDSKLLSRSLVGSWCRSNLVRELLELVLVLLRLLHLLRASRREHDLELLLQHRELVLENGVLGLELAVLALPMHDLGRLYGIEREEQLLDLALLLLEQLEQASAPVGWCGGVRCVGDRGSGGGVACGDTCRRHGVVDR